MGRTTRVIFKGFDGRDYEALRIGTRNGILRLSYKVPGREGWFTALLTKEQAKGRVRARKGA